MLCAAIGWMLCPPQKAGLCKCPCFRGHHTGIVFAVNDWLRESKSAAVNHSELSRYRTVGSYLVATPRQLSDSYRIATPIAIPDKVELSTR